MTTSRTPARARRLLAAAALTVTPALLASGAASAAGDANGAFGVSAAPGPSTSATRITTVAPIPAVTGTSGSRNRSSIYIGDTVADRHGTVGSATVSISPTSASSTASTVRLYAAVTSDTAELAADSIAASCSFDPATGAVAGSTTVTNGSRTNLIGISTALPANPGVNTPGSGAATSYLLNRQTTNADGSLTVDGLVYTDSYGNVIRIASVTCQPAELLAVPVASPLVGGLAAAGVAGVVGTVALARSRRRRLAATVA